MKKLTLRINKLLLTIMKLYSFNKNKMKISKKFLMMKKNK